MSTETEARAAEPSTPTLFARKSSGMVREVSAVDMLAFNAASTGGVGIALVIGVFYVFGSFPGANIYVVLPIGLAVMGAVWLTFALMSATFPRAGGDYLFGSRVLHPIVGFASNLGVFASTILAAGLWGAFVTNVGIAPTFAIIGTTTGHKWWLDASQTLSHKGWTLGIAIALIVAVSVLSALRTRVVARVVTWTFLIGVVGFAVAFVILLFTSHDHFVRSINTLAEPLTHKPNTYQDTIDAGRKAGLQYPSEHGYAVRGTFGALYAALALFMFTFWGVYMAGEMKQGGRRKRQISTILGAGYAQGALVVIAAFVFIKTVGYNFIAAANAGAFPVKVTPYYNFFAAVVADSAPVAIFIGLTFIAFFLPGMFINLAMCQRSLFAWSFDGLIPGWFARVSPRTRTPVNAIATVAVGSIACAIYVVYASNVLQVLTITAILLALPVIVTGLAGLLLPTRLPHIYKGSPADWRVHGVPVLPIASAGAVIIGLLFYVLVSYFHTELGVSNGWIMPVTPVACFIVAGLYYWVARAVQRDRGVELDYVYKAIPPD